MSIRRTLSIVAAVLVVGSLAAVVALVFLTELIDRNTDNLMAAVNRVHRVEASEILLLTHSRTEESTARAALERDVRKGLDGSYEYGPEHVEALDRIDAYFRGPGHSKDLERAISALDRLVASNIRAAEANQVEARRWDKIEGAIGVATALLLVSLAGSVLIAARMVVLRPIEEINAAMKRFAAGDREVYVDEQGPAELRAIAEQFNQMSRALARQQEHELTFLAGVAHDLRNPLSALRLSTESMAPDRPLPAEDRLRRHISLIGRQTKYLERMITDLLDRTRIEAGNLELKRERCDAAQLVCEAVELFRGTTSKHQLESVLPKEPVPLYADPVRLAQVLNNLVSNAIKYSPEGGRVQVAVEAENGSARFLVSDQGRGIDPSEVDRVFEPFRRATLDEIPGVGLGLSVARRIVEAHGGRIELESQIGRGTTFRITLPNAMA